MVETDSTMLEGEVRRADGDEFSRQQAIYLGHLLEMTDKHGELLLPVAKAALEEQTARADHLDAKANRVLTAAVAALAAFSAFLQAGKVPAVAGAAAASAVSGWLVCGVLVLLAAAVLAAVGAHVTASWFGLDPKSFLAEGVIRHDPLYLQRHLLLHHLDCFERNAKAAERKGTAIQVAQLLLIGGIALLAIGALR